MKKKLVIVESPSKSHTIEKYLGSDYKVVSSLGHIRDLKTTGKFGLGVDVENNFEPSYGIIKGKNKLVTALKKDVKDSSFVYLATDPDREGEAISWHLYDTLGLKDNYKRIVFNEITKDVILNSFNNARDIDYDLVKSQETRRILDRIIGFRLSKLMQSKTDGKSAGRVQSVALKLVVDKEREIEAFIPEDYYEIEAHFKDFDAKLDTYNNKEIEIKTENEAKEILNKLSNSFDIVSIDKKEKAKKAKYPVRIWSAACSSGQEPYSIGMIIQEQMSKMLHIDPKQTQIIGTDLSPEMLSICRRGQYDVHALSRGLSPERKEKFFRPTHNPNMMAIDSRVKSMVEFRPMNLLGSYALMGRFDVIFCRNVLIYFSNDVKADILRKLTMCLNPGGYLILGSTETLVGVADKYEMMRCNPGIIYHLKPQKYAF